MNDHLPYQMGTMISPPQFQELTIYPENRFSFVICSRWITLTNSLMEYAPPLARSAINPERKWELVSALQKSIRRGDKEAALNVIAMMESLPEEYAYFWRRLCVIACEDVGPADEVLAAFVVACSTIFTPKRTGSANYGLLCFLAEQMCELVNRSRIYCSYAVITQAAKDSMLPALSDEAHQIVAAIFDRSALRSLPPTAWEEWQRRNDWRAAGLVKFIGLRLPFTMTTVTAPCPAHRMMWGLPSYSYDMYTRVGLEMLKRLVRGVHGGEGIRRFFRDNRVKSAHTALGEAIFFEEGGRIRGELVYEPLCRLEQSVFSHQFNLSVDTWMDLRILANKALSDGVVNQIRGEVLDLFYGSRNCNQLHEQLRFNL